MNYPLISEYVDAIRSAEDNFDKLSDLRPVLDGNGNPVMSSGNFAVVFKMKDVMTGRMYAVKCFTREQEGREEAYRQIVDELELVQSTYLAKVRYYDHELFVDTNSSDDSEFPVLLMDWVEGETLDRYVRRNINDTYALEMLAYNFSRFAMWLLSQPFAHGDLKPDNILVQADGSLTLVDYDGMYVPAMQGQKSRELGSPDFRHPLRTDADFNEHIDDFPAISILLSLRLIATNPSLLDKYGASDRLLFAENDYRDLSSCALLKSVFPSQDAEINTLISLFTIVYKHKTLSNVSFCLLSVSEPDKAEIMKKEDLSTRTTHEDWINAITDEFGAKYSKDGKRLLKGVNIVKYEIKEGTKIICDKAFYDCFLLQEIIIPSSATNIGDMAFYYCKLLQKISIPNSVRTIGANPFGGCKCVIINNSSCFKVINNVLYNCNLTRLISFLSKQNKFTIPTSVTHIEDIAFSLCSSLQEITIPASVTHIGISAFYNCSSLQKITISSNISSIGINTFSTCRSLQEIIIPSSVTSIEDRAFEGCSSLSKIIIPTSVTAIGKDAFHDCKSLQKISIPSSVTNIGEGAFSHCCSLLNITIPASVISIGDCAFCYCRSLQKIVIGMGVTDIGALAFSHCTSLHEIVIPTSVASIGEFAFECCNSLQRIVIPSNVISIEDHTFEGCSSLQEIIIKPGVTSIGNLAFCNCTLFQNIIIPSSITSIGDRAFSGCNSLKEIVIPPNVINIGVAAFENCSSLQKVVISPNVTNINVATFKGCYSLQEIVIPQSITSIGSLAFFECDSLQKIKIPKGSKAKFEQILHNYKNLLIEIDNI